MRTGVLQVLIWKRAKDPYRNCWSLPGGFLARGERLEESIRRHLATKVDVRELAHLEQLETRSDPGRNPLRWELATAYLGLVPSDQDPAIPADTRWFPVDELPQMAFDHGPIVLAGRERLRGKLSYTNIGFALAPPRFTISELRVLYRAALGHDVSATNLQRVLVRRNRGILVGGHEPEIGGRELPAQRIALGVAAGLELLEVGELAHVDLRRQMAADRLLERLALQQLTARQRPLARERLEGALPQQHLKPAVARLQHYRDDHLRGCNRFRSRIGNHGRLSLRLSTLRRKPS